jgi:glycerol-3-phosphate dehydrogenase (NAD(P)+)
VPLPKELKVEHVGAGVARADYVFLGVPSGRFDGAIAQLEQGGLSQRAAVVSLAKGLVPPNGTPPTALLRYRFGPNRIACLGGPAHAGEMVRAGAGLVAASTDEALAKGLAGVFVRAGVVCEQSNDPIGVELAGAAKNAAALASGATEAQGLNAAGAAAGHIFAEVWRWAESQGARPESMIGLAGTGDLVATALAPESRNRRAGELLARGVPAAEIPARIGQAVEALESVPLLARALHAAGLDAPVNTALARLIEGTLPLDDWVAVVRATVPPPARWRPQVQPGFWRRTLNRVRGLFRRRARPELPGGKNLGSGDDGRGPGPPPATAVTHVPTTEPGVPVIDDPEAPGVVAPIPEAPPNGAAETGAGQPAERALDRSATSAGEEPSRILRGTPPDVYDL